MFVRLTLKHSCVTLVTYKPYLTYLKPWHHVMSGAIYATLLGSMSMLPLSRRRAKKKKGVGVTHRSFQIEPFQAISCTSTDKKNIKHRNEVQCPLNTRDSKRSKPLVGKSSPRKWGLLGADSHRALVRQAWTAVGTLPWYPLHCRTMLDHISSREGRTKHAAKYGM